MLEGEELEKAIKAILKQIGIVNTKYIKKIAAQIKKIGELNPSSVNRLVAMSEMNNNLGEITEQLRQALGVSSRGIQKIYEKALQEVYTDPRFSRYLEEEPDAVRPEARQKLTNYVQALWKQTAGNLYNYSNTTALRQTYIDAIDKAVLATSMGVSSYTETMRSTIRQLGSAGMQVVYASGYHRRLDTAVRQNIVDAVNQINKNASVMLADELNETAGEDIYDAIEISAHARSAPDHEPVQGHVFMKAEWEKLQAGLVSRDIDGRVFAGFRRPIGEWNCRHTPMSFSTKWSKRKWTDEQLRKFIDENRQGCEIDGKHRTLYEAMQMMREIETAVRREKDTAVAAQAAGDDAMRQQCQRNINALVRRYAEIAKASGNAEKRQRMTVEGFRAVKVPEDSEKVLTSGGGSGKIMERKQPNHRGNALSPFGSKVQTGSELWIERAKSNLYQTEREISDGRSEIAVLFKPDGSEAFRKNGDASSVTFSESERNQMIGCILTHNHPNNTPFSHNDISFLLDNGLEEIRAVVKGETYILQRTWATVKRPPDLETVESDFYKYYDKIGNKYRELSAKDGRPFGYYLRVIDEETVKELSKKYGLNFLLEVDEND